MSMSLPVYNLKDCRYAVGRSRLKRIRALELKSVHGRQWDQRMSRKIRTYLYYSR